ncbi:PilW family protein [Glaciimonas sp. CA11.2]|uniref:PilW family protein n=1 Tax=Glaciimonas sp. CA11.2 TaxID=3048601 RepID=UPI002AB5AB33|nr:PilW family protein [Glaciimonas sp. CA11.2]MDY7547332.1 PilW family protein [Glaciimonas sp. CA11.2]MEB0163486.1 PilW family protein [Glaciimonas sp. CA11.2]
MRIIFFRRQRLARAPDLYRKVCKAREGGVTIVELMVTMMISVGLIAAVGSLYFGSKTSYRMNQNQLRLQQDGRYAMQLMELNLRQAGFGHLTSASVNAAEVDKTDFVGLNGKPGQGLRGCDSGFTKPLSHGFVCNSSDEGAAAFEVAYRVADTFDFDNGAGADCNGSQAGVVALPESHPGYSASKAVAIASNRFFVATPSGRKTTSLYCQGNSGNGRSIAQPILNNVENMRLVFGVAAIDGFSVKQFLTATQVDGLSPDQHQNWKRVVRVKLCLQLHASERNASTPQRYVDCDGVEQMATDGKLRTVMTSIVTLRNNAATTQSEPTWPS